MSPQSLPYPPLHLQLGAFVDPSAQAHSIPGYKSLQLSVQGVVRNSLLCGKVVSEVLHDTGVEREKSISFWEDFLLHLLRGGVIPSRQFM